MLYKYENSYFFGSQYIKVFPCSYRGEYEKAGKKNSFDPEARLNTEYNFVNLPGFAGHTSYIKSYNKILRIQQAWKTNNIHRCFYLDKIPNYNADQLRAKIFSGKFLKIQQDL
jgi:hypothetical protein